MAGKTLLFAGRTDAGVHAWAHLQHARWIGNTHLLIYVRR